MQLGYVVDGWSRRIRPFDGHFRRHFECETIHVVTDDRDEFISKSNIEDMILTYFGTPQYNPEGEHPMVDMQTSRP